MRTARSTNSLKNKASSGHGYGIHCSEDASFSEASRTLVTQNSLCTPEICFVTLQSTFLPQESALLRHKALFCPRNLHCYTAKHFSAPEICIVTQQSAFLPQESALLRHKALFACPLELSCLGRVSRILPTSNQKPRPQTSVNRGWRRGFPYAGLLR